MSRVSARPKIQPITNRLIATMLNLIRSSLARFFPPADGNDSPHAWSNEDSSWHSSSFELARGLEVIEHRGALVSVFADTMPAFHLPRA